MLKNGYNSFILIIKDLFKMKNSGGLKYMQQEQVTLEEVWRLFKESDKRWKEMTEETNRQFRETDKKIKEVSTAIGNLGNRLGEFVEEMVMPSALRLLQARGIEVYEMYPRAQSKRLKKRGVEIDLLLVNSNDVVAVEVKSKLAVEHIDLHLKKLEELKTFFPHYKDFNLYGAVAGMVVTQDVADYGINKGLFVFIPADDSMNLANDTDFTPKTW